jgi:hypothetical protein
MINKITNFFKKVKIEDIQKETKIISNNCAFVSEQATDMLSDLIENNTSEITKIVKDTEEKVSELRDVLVNANTEINKDIDTLAGDMGGAMKIIVEKVDKLELAISQFFVSYSEQVKKNNENNENIINALVADNKKILETIASNKAKDLDTDEIVGKLANILNKKNEILVNKSNETLNAVNKSTSTFAESLGLVMLNIKDLAKTSVNKVMGDINVTSAGYQTPEDTVEQPEQLTETLEEETETEDENPTDFINGMLSQNLVSTKNKRNLTLR